MIYRSSGYVKLRNHRKLLGRRDLERKVPPMFEWVMATPADRRLSPPQIFSFSPQSIGRSPKIRQTYDPQMKQAKSPEEGKRIQDEAVSKMRQAITRKK
jgi:hypothetical protein